MNPVHFEGPPRRKLEFGASAQNPVIATPASLSGRKQSFPGENSSTPDFLAFTPIPVLCLHNSTPCICCPYGPHPGFWSWLRNSESEFGLTSRLFTPVSNWDSQPTPLISRHAMHTSQKRAHFTTIIYNKNTDNFILLVSDIRCIM